MMISSKSIKFALLSAVALPQLATAKRVRPQQPKVSFSPDIKSTNVYSSGLRLLTRTDQKSDDKNEAETQNPDSTTGEEGGNTNVASDGQTNGPVCDEGTKISTWRKVQNSVIINAVSGGVVALCAVLFLSMLWVPLGKGFLMVDDYAGQKFADAGLLGKTFFYGPIFLIVRLLVTVFNWFQLSKSIPQIAAFSSGATFDFQGHMWPIWWSIFMGWIGYVHVGAFIRPEIERNSFYLDNFLPYFIGFVYALAFSFGPRRIHNFCVKSEGTFYKSNYKPVAVGVEDIYDKFWTQIGIPGLRAVGILNLYSEFLSGILNLDGLVTGQDDRAL